MKPANLTAAALLAAMFSAPSPAGAERASAGVRAEIVRPVTLDTSPGVASALPSSPGTAAEAARSERVIELTVETTGSENLVYDAVIPGSLLVRDTAERGLALELVNAGGDGVLDGTAERISVAVRLPGAPGRCGKLYAGTLPFVIAYQ